MARSAEPGAGVVVVANGVITVGRGDAGPFRRGGTMVGQGVAALVAIGDGADAGHAHGARSSSGGRGSAGRTRRCTIAVAVIIVTSVGVQSMRMAEQRSATAT